MLTAYLDDSREQHPAGADFHAIAGYLAPLELWDNEFSPRWSRILESGPSPISEFKASDCSWPSGVFSGWSRNDVNDMIVRVVDEVTDPIYRNLFGIGAVMYFPSAADNALNSKFQEIALQECLRETIVAACCAARGVWGPQPIELVSDIFDPALQARFTRAWRAVKGGLEGWYGARLSQINFRDSKDIAGIQAADLLAYELRADLKHRMVTPQRQMNISLRRMLAAKPHISFYYDVEILKAREAALNNSGQWGGPPLFCLSPQVTVFGRDSYLIHNDTRPIPEPLPPDPRVSGGFAS